MTRLITISIVSHAQVRLVEGLLGDLLNCPEVSRVVLTSNVPEREPEVPAGLKRRTVVLRNLKPKGFGANHNAAFSFCESAYFCVLNPDIRFEGNPFPPLLDCLEGGGAVCAPMVIATDGSKEDSVRYFPTIGRLCAKFFGVSDGCYSYERNDVPFCPDWVAGMFMLFSSKDYRAVGGFDEKYFLYYEDVDICARIWRAGRKVVFCPQVAVTHFAQRASRRNPRHMYWHMQSMFRYFFNYWGRLPSTSGVRIGCSGRS